MTSDQIDPIRQNWQNAYTGRTDNGFELPIEQVVPGCFCQGEPIGYWPASFPEQVEQAWEWKVANHMTVSDESGGPKRPIRRKKPRMQTGLSFKADPKAYMRSYVRQRCAQDPLFRAIQALRCRVNYALSDKARKAGKTLELIGCNPSQLRAHLESQFEDGMSWLNYGQWHIDHERPCCSFDLNQPSQQRACFHWSNLQPLWAFDNLSKGGKYAA